MCVMFTLTQVHCNPAADHFTYYLMTLPQGFDVSQNEAFEEIPRKAHQVAVSNRHKFSIKCTATTFLSSNMCCEWKIKVFGGPFILKSTIVFKSMDGSPTSGLFRKTSQSQILQWALILGGRFVLLTIGLLICLTTFNFVCMGCGPDAGNI